MSQKADATAILAAINAQSTSVRAYERSDPAVASLTSDHILVDLSRRYVPERRASGEVTMPGGRVMTRYVSKRINNIYELRARTATALEDKILTTADGEVGPFVFESDEPAGPDDGWFSAADSWTF